MSKYAVYLVIVEDTEENDMAVMERIPLEAGERIAGDLDMQEAKDILTETTLAHGNTDIAR